jgi:uncharacterized protein
MSTSSLRTIHERIWKSVKDLWEPNAIFGHGIDHAHRAYSHGIHIAEREGADPLPVGAACYLMDAGLDLLEGRKDHIKRGLEIARRLLQGIPELHGVKDKIMAAILHHEAEDDPPDDSPIEVIVVRDSDTLDRLGMTGVRMTLTYGVWVSRPLCHPDDPLCNHREPQLNDFTMDYISYLFSLESRLLTPTARDIGYIKLREMRTFCEALKGLCRKSHMPSYDDAFALVEKLKKIEGNAL